MTVVTRECDYAGCEETGMRHLMGRHFCGGHHSLVVDRARELNADLYEYVREVCEE